MRLFVPIVVALVQVVSGTAPSYCTLASTYVQGTANQVGSCQNQTGYAVTFSSSSWNGTASGGSCVVQNGTSATVWCATGYQVVGNGSTSVTGTCFAGPNVWNGTNLSVASFSCAAVPVTCTVTCTSISNGGCVTSNGTVVASGTTVTPGTTVSCNVNSTAQTTTTSGGTCSTTGAALNLTCVGPGAPLSSFSSVSQAVAYLSQQGIPFSSPGSACNAVCVGSVPTVCVGVTAFQCSPCYTPCTTTTIVTTRAVVPNGVVPNGGVVVVCPVAAAAQQACFQSAACAGLLVPGQGCGLNGVGVCPKCNASKKGLLGLLGLLGLIPLLLCCSLLCTLLICFLRRRKTADPVHFATFDGTHSQPVCPPAHGSVVMAPAPAPVMCSAGFV